MGGCLGKKSSKYSTRYETVTEKVKIQKVISDDVTPKKSSPSLSKKLETNGAVTEDNNELCQTSNEDQTTSIDPEIQLVIDEQKIINEIFSKPLSPRVVSTTESELEYELAKLVYGHPEKDYTESSLTPTTTTNKTDNP